MHFIVKHTKTRVRGTIRSEAGSFFVVFLVSVKRLGFYVSRADVCI